jgi:hypothetical protein
MLKVITVSMLLGLTAVIPAKAQTSPHPSSVTASSHAPAKAAHSLANDQFSSEQAATAHCPGGTIVWANLSGSKAYHPAGDKYYGKTKHGAYMCQKEADQAGFHATGQRGGKSAAKSTDAKSH